MKASSLGQDDCPSIIECWYFISLPLLLLKVQKLHLLNYSDVTKKSIIITFFRFIIYVMYYALLLR
jgi:hypothetical protein